MGDSPSAARIQRSYLQEKMRKYFTVKIGTALVLIATCCVALYLHLRPRVDPYRGPEFALRELQPAELGTLAKKALEGDCKSAYLVARHHLYFSLDDKGAIRFLRIAINCPNANAFAHLAALLTDDPKLDREVDGILISLKKLDPQAANEASTQIALRRQARTYK